MEYKIIAKINCDEHFRPDQIKTAIKFYTDGEGRKWVIIKEKGASFPASDYISLKQGLSFVVKKIEERQKEVLEVIISSAKEIDGLLALFKTVEKLFSWVEEEN